MLNLDQEADEIEIKRLTYSVSMCIFNLMTDMAMIWDEWLHRLKQYYEQIKNIWLNT